MIPHRRRRLALALVAPLLVAALGSARPQEGPEGTVVVPFELLPSNHMVVEVTINDEGPYDLIFDVGAPVTLLSNRAARESGLIEERRFPMLFGAQGEEEVERLDVGDLTAEEVPVLVMDHPVVKALGKMLDKPLDGLVGHTFFARYKTTIDYQAETMTFEPVDSEIRDFMLTMPERLMGPKAARRIILEPAALLGLRFEDLEADGDLGVTVRDVVADSPAAEAGLKPGDVLLELDGRWTTSVADAFEAASKIEPGVAVPVVVRRDDERLERTITPAAGF